MLTTTLWGSRLLTIVILVYLYNYSISTFNFSISLYCCVKSQLLFVVFRCGTFQLHLWNYFGFQLRNRFSWNFYCWLKRIKAEIGFIIFSSVILFLNFWGFICWFGRSVAAYAITICHLFMCVYTTVYRPQFLKHVFQIFQTMCLCYMNLHINYLVSHEYCLHTSHIFIFTIPINLKYYN